MPGTERSRTEGRKAESGGESCGRKPVLEVERKRREERAELRKDNRLIHGRGDVRTIGLLFTLVFVLMAAYYSWFIVVRSPEVLKHTANSRNAAESSYVIRGSILSRDGQVLVDSELAWDKSEQRTYTHGPVFAHVLGYSARGVTGLESTAASYLLDAGLSAKDKILLDVTGEKVKGNSVTTTLDVALQQIAYEQLGNQKGAVVALDPKTGAILAMVSKPDFDPNSIAADWENILADTENSRLVNRAAQGLYPPGSTFKVLTALEYFREYPDTWEQFVYDCTGRYTEGNVSIQCVHETAHGPLTIAGGIAMSCNGVFLTLGSQMDMREYRKTVENFGFNEKLPIPMEYRRSSFVLDQDSSVWDRCETVFGQGQTLISPLHMAMIASSIANGGEMMKPYLIQSVQSAEGETVKTFRSEVFRRVMSEPEAETLTAMMAGAVNSGTGYLTQSDRYQSACKTGSAEFDGSGETHAWYMGFAPAEDPQIAVAVLIENGGSGGINAGPIAKMLYDSYLLR